MRIPLHTAPLNVIVVLDCGCRGILGDITACYTPKDRLIRVLSWCGHTYGNCQVHRGPKSPTCSSDPTYVTSSSSTPTRHVQLDELMQELLED